VHKTLAEQLLLTPRKMGGDLESTINPRIKKQCRAPICPYRQTAKYKGSGNIEDAANFECKTKQGSVVCKSFNDLFLALIGGSE
jgi:hypothetical protein